MVNHFLAHFCARDNIVTLTAVAAAAVTATAAAYRFVVHRVSSHE